jgi:hypothetical protein
MYTYVWVFGRKKGFLESEAEFGVRVEFAVWKREFEFELNLLGRVCYGWVSSEWWVHCMRGQ